MRVRFWCVLCAWLVTFGAGNSASAALQHVDIQSYYAEPPFVISPDHGLSYDLVQYLNDHAHGAFDFTLVIEPRKRLDRSIERGEPVVVPWASPNWFRNAVGSLVQWTQPFVWGASVIVTNPAEPVVYEGPQSLVKLSLAGVTGHQYYAIDSFVKDGRIKRQDMNNYEDVFRLIANRPGHFSVSSIILARYLTKEMQLDGKIAFAQPYHQKFTRSFLVQHSDPAVFEFLNDVAGKMQTDPKWHEILARYGLGDLSEPGLIGKQ